MSTTWSPSRRSRDQRRHDVVHCGDVARLLARRREIGHQLLRRQPLLLGQARAEDGREDDVVSGVEGARERLLEDLAARRGRPRLEDRPDPVARVRRAERQQRLGDGRRVVREVVVDRHARHGADRLEPALHALETPQALGQRGGVDAHGVADGQRRQRVAHVVRAEQRHLERAAACAPRAARRRSSRPAPPGGRSRASPPRPTGRTSRPATARTPSSPPPPGCRCRAAAGPGSARGSRAGGTRGGSRRGRRRCRRGRTRCCR